MMLIPLVLCVLRLIAPRRYSLEQGDLLHVARGGRVSVTEVHR